MDCHNITDVSGAEWHCLHDEPHGQLWHIHEATARHRHRLQVHLSPRLSPGQHARTVSTRVLLQSTGQRHLLWNTLLVSVSGSGIIQESPRNIHIPSRVLLNN